MFGSQAGSHLSSAHCCCWDTRSCTISPGSRAAWGLLCGMPLAEKKGAWSSEEVWGCRTAYGLGLREFAKLLFQVYFFSHLVAMRMPRQGNSNSEPLAVVDSVVAAKERVAQDEHWSSWRRNVQCHERQHAAASILRPLAGAEWWSMKLTR